MKKIIIFLALLMLIGCTQRVTKQFIVEQNDTTFNAKKADNWIIEPPKLVAYKNKLVDKIENRTYLFWLSMNTYGQRNLNPNNILHIDSVGFHFVELDSTVWSYPSRVTPYKQSKKYSYLAFDFFKNNGVDIPETVSNINLFFDAVLIDTIKNDRTSHKIQFEMTRQDTTKTRPFLIQ